MLLCPIFQLRNPRVRSLSNLPETPQLEMLYTQDSNPQLNLEAEIFHPPQGTQVDGIPLPQTHGSATAHVASTEVAGGLPTGAA